MEIPSSTMEFVADAELGQGRKSLRTSPVSATAIEWDEDEFVCVCLVSPSQSVASSEGS